MSIIIDEFGETINIPSAESLLQVYCHILNLNGSDTLAWKDKKKIFLLSVADFQLGKLSTDGISEVASALMFSPPFEEDSYKDEVEGILLSASELSWEIRKIGDSDPEGDGFIEIMISILKYFKENKALIEKYIENQKKVSEKSNKAKQLTDMLLGKTPNKK
jgi:hypothetical protein